MHHQFVQFLNFVALIFRGKICEKPKVVQSLKPYKVTAGRAFTFMMPEATFFDLEDGNTRYLSLAMTQKSSNFPRKCWYSFNSTSQRLNGLSYSNLLNKNNTVRFLFNVTATDTCGLSAMDNLSLSLNRPERHCFEMTLVFTASKRHDCEWVPVKNFVNKVAVFYGYDATRDMTVVDYGRTKNNIDQYSVRISFSPRIIKCDQCDSTAIANLTFKVLHKSNYTVHYAFNAFLSPMFTVSKVYVAAVDTCAGYILPLKAEKQSVIPILAWLIPVLIFAIALALILLCALCRYCGWCTCCMCLFPVDDDEGYFLRREAPRRKHRSYQEFVGGDVDHNFPSMRKNRAGLEPDETSIESAEDIITSDDDNPPPYYNDKSNKSGIKSDDKSDDSVPVTTIVYATPHVGKESTELSVFPNGGDRNGGCHNDNVNVMYHNLAETSFQSGDSDDDNYRRVHGSFESLKMRHSGSSGSSANGTINRGFSGCVTLDMEQINAGTNGGARGGNADGDMMVPPPHANRDSRVERVGNQGNSSDKLRSSSTGNAVGGFGPVPPPLSPGGIANAAFEAGEDYINVSETNCSTNGSTIVFGGRDGHGVSNEEFNVAIFGDLSGCNDERNALIGARGSSVHFSGKDSKSHVAGKGVLTGTAQGNAVKDRGIAGGCEGENGGGNKKRKNAVKVKSHARKNGLSHSGIDNGGLLDEEERNKCSRLADFEVSGKMVESDDDYDDVMNQHESHAMFTSNAKTSIGIKGQKGDSGGMIAHEMHLGASAGRRMNVSSATDASLDVVCQIESSTVSSDMTKIASGKENVTTMHGGQGIDFETSSSQRNRSDQIVNIDSSQNNTAGGFVSCTSIQDVGNSRDDEGEEAKIRQNDVNRHEKHMSSTNIILSSGKKNDCDNCERKSSSHHLCEKYQGLMVEGATSSQSMSEAISTCEVCQCNAPQAKASMALKNAVGRSGATNEIVAERGVECQCCQEECDENSEVTCLVGHSKACKAMNHSWVTKHDIELEECKCHDVHYPCNENTELTCLVGRSNDCKAARHVTCSELIEMKRRRSREACSKCLPSKDKSYVQEQLAGKPVCSHKLLSGRKSQGDEGGYATTSKGMCTECFDVKNVRMVSSDHQVICDDCAGDGKHAALEQRGDVVCVHGAKIVTENNEGGIGAISAVAGDSNIQRVNLLLLQFTRLDAQFMMT